MKTIVLLFSILALSMCAMPRPAAARDIAIIPKPMSMEIGEGIFVFMPDAVIVADDSLHGLASYLQQHLADATGLTLNITGGDCVSNCIALYLEPDLPGPGDEGYLLDVTPERVIITAAAPAGLFYGIQSLRQLLPPENAGLMESDETLLAEIPCVSIKDRPRFKWRGLMLDVARHFEPKEFVLKQIDAMALFKLNRLHLHLTDDQGWRLEIKKYPALTEIGSRRGKSTPADELSMNPTGPAHGGFFTQDDMREIIAYAQQRFITIVPEIEMPGHAQAALASVPGLACRNEKFKVYTRWGVNKDVYCAGNDEVFTFLQDVLTEVADLFPGEYIHIGGDEVPKDRWKECPKCQARIKAEGLKDENELQSYFIKRIEKFVVSKGKKIIGWDEILEGGLAPEAAVMSWRGTQGGMLAAMQGHDVVMSPTSNCYFDYYQAKEGEPRAIGGFLPLDAVYSFEPIPPTLGPSSAKHILGAQGNLWTEHIDNPAYAEYMLYPRAMALAEITWSQKDDKNFDDFLRRLAPSLNRLDTLGVNYRNPFTAGKSESR